MFRKIALFLCVLGLISASDILDGGPVVSNAPTKTELPNFSPSVWDALNAQARYAIPVDTRILQPQHTRIAVQPETKETQANVVQNTKSSRVVHAYFAKPDVRVSINPAIVKIISAPTTAPATEKKEVETRQKISVNPPATTVSPVEKQIVQHNIQPIVKNSALQYISAEPPQAVSSASQVSSNAIYETVTAHPPPAAYYSSVPQSVHRIQTVALRPAAQYVSAPVTHNDNPRVVSTVPLHKKIAVQAYQPATAHPPTATYVTAQPIARFPDYDQVPAVHDPAIRYVLVPASEHAYSLVRVPINSYQSLENELDSHQSAPLVSETVAPVSVPNVQHVIDRPIAQYISAPVSQVKPVVVKPVAPVYKADTVKVHKSVTAHPPTRAVVNPPSVQYVSAPFTYTAANSDGLHKTSTVVANDASQVVYAEPPARRPIPVPVIYSAEETPEYVEPQKPIHPTSVFVAYEPQVTAPQPIPVPVAYPTDYKEPPVVYAQSVENKENASDDVVAHLRPGYTGYVRAVKYSPSSAVSSVSFNGLGTSYGW